MFLVIRYKKESFLYVMTGNSQEGNRIVISCTLKTAYSKKIFEQCFLKQIEKTSSKYIERCFYKIKNIYDINQRYTHSISSNL